LGTLSLASSCPGSSRAITGTPSTATVHFFYFSFWRCRIRRGLLQLPVLRLGCFRRGMSESASFQRARKSFWTVKVCRWASFEFSIATCRISREPAADIARSISRSLDPCSPRPLAASAAGLCLHAATPPNNGPRKCAVSNHAFQAFGCSCAPAECAPAHRGAQSYSATLHFNGLPVQVTKTRSLSQASWPCRA